MAQKLDHLDRVFINFRDFSFGNPGDHGYRWVDLKRFRLPSTPCDDEGLLDALIGHDQFRDDYAGGGVNPAGTRHGSYWLEHIVPSAYEPVTEAAALGLLDIWARQYGDLPYPLEETLEREIYALVRSATSLHHLTMREGTHHDYGHVHGEFHELIAIDRDARTLGLIVAADD